MLPPAIQVSPLAARRFLRRILLLDEPVATIAAALHHHGYVQIDPINVCGRMHDLILRHRVRDYREGDLMRHLHGSNDVPSSNPEPGTQNPEPGTRNSEPGTRNSEPRAQRDAFEHHLPDTNVLVAFPLDAWPHLLAAMRRRTGTRNGWYGKLTPRERVLADHILAELAARGPLASDHFNDDRRARRIWGSATLAKSTLQKLFFHGRVLISRRIAQRRLYDLPERVLPAAVLAAPVPPAADTARWLVILRLRQRRLITLRRQDLPLVEDLIQPVTVAGCPPLYCLRADVPLLETPASSSSTSTSNFDCAAAAPPPQLLAPLDPLLYDRRVTATLWGFDYTWEVYTPPHKRVRGYYALPVLSGLELVGHVDPKADRLRRKLIVVARSVRRGHRVGPALDNLARFLCLRR